MSFSSEVKEELSHVDGHEIHCKIAELAAIIGLCGRLQCEEGRYSLILHTENVAVARRFYSLIKEVFYLQPGVSTTQHDYLKKNRFYMISVKDSVQTLKILKTVQLINNLGQMDEEFFVKDNPAASSNVTGKSIVLISSFLTCPAGITPSHFIAKGIRNTSSHI